MDKEKITLKDSTECEIENGAVENSITMVVPTLEEFIIRYNCMSEENLAEFTIKKAEGLICTTLQNKVVKEAAVSSTTGGYKVVFRLGDVDMIAKRLKELEDRTDTLDGAVGDLGATTSTLAAQEGMAQ